MIFPRDITWICISLFETILYKILKEQIVRTIHLGKNEKYFKWSRTIQCGTWLRSRIKIVAKTAPL